jgi:hypothetical protein
MNPPLGSRATSEKLRLEQGRWRDRLEWSRQGVTAVGWLSAWAAIGREDAPSPSGRKLRAVKHQPRRISKVSRRFLVGLSVQKLGYIRVADASKRSRSHSPSLRKAVPAGMRSSLALWLSSRVADRAQTSPEGQRTGLPVVLAFIGDPHKLRPDWKVSSVVPSQQCRVRARECRHCNLLDNTRGVRIDFSDGLALSLVVLEG